MQESCRPQRSGRLVVSLLSVLALLAFACFPVVAQAENVYEPETPTIPGTDIKPPSHKPKNNAHEKSSEAEVSGSPSGGGTGGTGSGTPGGDSSSNTGQTGDGGNTGQTSQGGGPQTSHDQSGSLGEATEQPAASKTQTSSDGGSSPLVPILIAVAVLAAISIGAVVVRQRRGHVSPKAS